MLFEIKDLQVEYSVPGGIAEAVNKASLNVAEGESLGLAGESGCGKTTLGNAILRILPGGGQITGGSIDLNGVDLVKLREEEMRQVRWRDISMIFQGAMNSFDPTMIIENQIAEGILIHQRGTSKETALKRTRELLGLCEISPLLGKRYPHELSGGMKQRACIAMALALQPKLLIADEITTALDVMTQAQIFTLLRDMRRKFSLSMIIVSHDLTVLAKNCDRLAIMYAGHIVEVGTIQDIFEHPQHPYVKGLLFCIPSFAGDREIIAAIKGAPPSLLDPPRGCPFHPRCPISIPECEVEVPQLVSVNTNNHSVACYRKDYKGDIWK